MRKPETIKRKPKRKNKEEKRKIICVAVYESRCWLCGSAELSWIIGQCLAYLSHQQTVRHR